MSVRRDDSIANLAHSSHEVDNALSSFMSERTRACNAQAEAMKLYDAEMLQISKEVEDEELRNKYVPSSANIDHNILRSINATGDEPGSYHLEIEDDSQAPPTSVTRQSSFDSNIGEIAPVTAAAKKNPPSQPERFQIRKQMLNFFDGCRDSEIDKFNELDTLLGGDSPKKAVDAVEVLFQEQTKNFGLLMNFLDEYQPEPFVKAWGNDPDYKKITKKYKVGKSDVSFKARATLATMKHKSSRVLVPGTPS